MNWGIKITALYIGFVALISSMVYISATNKSELVASDYYAQELNYQQKIDAITNEKQLKHTITHYISDNAVEFTFQSEEIAKDFEGEIFFFRPSDSRKDLKLKLKLDADGKQLIPKSWLHNGIYNIHISWINGGVTYYKEEKITI